MESKSEVLKLGSQRIKINISYHGAADKVELTRKRKWEVGSGKSEVGRGNSEFGIRKWGFGDRKGEVGSGNLEVGKVSIRAQRGSE